MADSLKTDPKITVEPSYRVYDDTDGWYVEVRPDGDGLGCVEVVYNPGTPGAADQPLGPISPAVAIKVAECMQMIARFREEHPL